MIKKFAVIGNPIAHSKSPQIHQAFAQQFNINLSYERILAPLNEFAETLSHFQKIGGIGVNITVPFKIEAAQLVHEKTQRATAANAVNTILLGEQWFGDNTDGEGLLNDLTINLNLSLSNKDILILGAGGATQGILPALLSANPRSIIIANRTLATAEKLANEKSGCLACTLANIPAQSYDLIINATSAGVKDENLALPGHLFKNSICYDLGYGESAQPFLQLAQRHVAKQAWDGIGMLVEQAAAAFYWWHHKKPKTQAVIKSLRGN